MELIVGDVELSERLNGKDLLRNVANLVGGHEELLKIGEVADAREDEKGKGGEEDRTRGERYQQ